MTAEFDDRTSNLFFRTVALLAFTIPGLLCLGLGGLLLSLSTLNLFELDYEDYRETDREFLVLILTMMAFGFVWLRARSLWFVRRNSESAFLFCVGVALATVLLAQS